MKNKMKKAIVALLTVLLILSNIIGVSYADGGVVSDTLTPTNPTPAPSTGPTDNVEPSEEPSEEPTEEPSEEPSEEPTEEPTEEPSEEPAEEPSKEPTEEPSEEPSEEPTEEPSEEPTEEPTEEPSEEPTEEPTEEPSEEPTEEPSEEPTEVPSEEPTAEPTPEPTPEPYIISEYSVSIFVIDPKPYYFEGDQLTLGSAIEGTCNEPSYQWQVLRANGESQTWEDIPGANAATYEYTLNDDNYKDSFRLVVVDLAPTWSTDAAAPANEDEQAENTDSEPAVSEEPAATEQPAPTKEPQAEQAEQEAESAEA